MRFERFNKRKRYWGGASAFQKGVAAELRTKVTGVTKNMLNGIVHSGDDRVETSFLFDSGNKYDPLADDIIVQALTDRTPDANLRAQRIYRYLRADKQQPANLLDVADGIAPVLKNPDPWPNLRSTYEAEPAHIRRKQIIATETAANAANIQATDRDLFIPISGDPNMFSLFAKPAGIQSATEIQTLGARVFAKRRKLNEDTTLSRDTRSAYGDPGNNPAMGSFKTNDILPPGQTPSSSTDITPSLRKTLPLQFFPAARSAVLPRTGKKAFDSRNQQLNSGYQLLESRGLLFPDDPYRLALVSKTNNPSQRNLLIYEFNPYNGTTTLVT